MRRLEPATASAGPSSRSRSPWRPPPASLPPGSTRRDLSRSRRTTRSTSTASRCATACGSSPPSTSPRTTRQPYPILLTRTPYSVQPYGVDQYKDDLGPSPLFGKEGYIFVYQDVRGRWMSEGEFVNMRPHNADKKGRRTSTRAPTPTTRSTGWSRTSPNNNGKVGMWGISYPGFYTAARHDRRPPGAQGRLAAGAGHRLVRRRRLAPQRRLLPAPLLQLPGRLRPAAARADQEVRRPSSTTARPTATTSSSSMGPLAQRRQEALQGRGRVLERGDGARHLRRLLEGPQPPAAPEGHQARR